MADIPQARLDYYLTLPDEIAGLCSSLRDAEAKLAYLRAIIRDGVPDQGSDCPECGFMVPVDEDGLCISCGRDVMWYHPSVALKADNTRLRASLAEAKEALLESEIAHDEESDCWNNIHRADRASLAAAEEVKATLLNALERSVHLQSHYAVQLNTYDAGERIGFASAADWLERLAVVDTPQETKQDVCPKCKGSGFETVQPDTEEE